VILAYLGSGEPPLLPKYEFLNVPDSHRFVVKMFQECNYLQANEGGIDPIHVSFLHRSLQEREGGQYSGVRGTDDSFYSLWGRDVAPAIEMELIDFGLRIYTVRKVGADKFYLRVTNFIYPNLSAFPAQTGAEGYNVNWHVPIDDTHHWKYAFVFSREKPLDTGLISRGRAEMTPDYRLIRNNANRYLQDRESMKTQSFSGIGFDVPSQDACVTEGQGPIQDRTREHLVSSDKAVVAARKLLSKAISDVLDGRDAPHVVRDPKSNRFSHLVVISELLPAVTDWKEYTKRAEGEARP
jgi:hypothetical protein